MDVSRQRQRDETQRAGQVNAEPAALTQEEALPILEGAEIVGGQRIPWSSNGTFLVHLDAGPGRYLRAVYKPRDGERPLHDFPTGSLYKREYAAYMVARSLGWPQIPRTLIRDGPYGVGSMQLFVESDPNITYFDLVADNADELLRFAVFDVLTNNADRKAGHCLLGSDGAIWSVDHGLTFHHFFKQRTVMLEFWGEQVPRPLLDDMSRLAKVLESKAGVAPELAEMLSEREMGALQGRIEAMLAEPVLPTLDPRRNVPWPLV